MRTLLTKWRQFRADRAAWHTIGDEADAIIRRHHRTVVAEHGRWEAMRMQWRDTYPDLSPDDTAAYDRLQARLHELTHHMPAWQRY